MTQQEGRISSCDGLLVIFWKGIEAWSKDKLYVGSTGPIPDATLATNMRDLLNCPGQDSLRCFFGLNFMPSIFDFCWDLLTACIAVSDLQACLSDLKIFSSRRDATYLAHIASWLREWALESSRSGLNLTSPA